jgi:hypothetical protein
MIKKHLAVPLAAFALVVSAGGGLVAAAHADTTSTTSTTTGAAQTHQRQKPAAVGTVAAVSGNTITLTDAKASTTYTVDATNAVIKKHSTPVAGQGPTAPTTITVSGIAVGDTIMVRGTVSGTTITATAIDDGQMMHGMMGRGGHGFGGPGVHGTVTAVNGTTLTVQDKDGKTYTVEAAGATAAKIQKIAVTDVQVGDSVEANGTLTGSTLTAKHLMDGVMEPDQAPTK